MWGRGIWKKKGQETKQPTVRLRDQGANQWQWEVSIGYTSPEPSGSLGREIMHVEHLLSCKNACVHLRREWEDTGPRPVS